MGGMIFSGFYIFYQTQLMIDQGIQIFIINSSLVFQAENHPLAIEDELGIHGDYDLVKVSLE